MFRLCAVFGIIKGVKNIFSIFSPYFSDTPPRGYTTTPKIFTLESFHFLEITKWCSVLILKDLPPINKVLRCVDSINRDYFTDKLVSGQIIIKEIPMIWINVPYKSTRYTERNTFLLILNHTRDKQCRSRLIFLGISCLLKAILTQTSMNTKQLTWINSYRHMALNCAK